MLLGLFEPACTIVAHFEEFLSEKDVHHGQDLEICHGHTLESSSNRPLRNEAFENFHFHVGETTERKRAVLVEAQPCIQRWKLPAGFLQASGMTPPRPDGRPSSRAPKKRRERIGPSASIDPAAPSTTGLRLLSARRAWVESNQSKIRASAWVLTESRSSKARRSLSKIHVGITGRKLCSPSKRTGRNRSGSFCHAPGCALDLQDFTRRPASLIEGLHLRHSNMDAKSHMLTTGLFSRKQRR